VGAPGNLANSRDARHRRTPRDRRFRHEHCRDVTPVLAFFEGLTRALAAEQERAGSALH